ncbi:MAG: acyltransferase domain-containing protein [Alphaproteobacteria bacterium]|nr:acyltransferase domain-containing protein [Alphaproteobacteria bacterium]MBM3653590.1 acyltransferase domain-containing protein [Alphaproteobacteria bacterium]
MMEDARRPGPLVFMFSGQGAQYYGMGRAFYDTEPVFQTVMDRLDAVAAPFVGGSILDILFSGADASVPFDALLHTHPALFMIQYAMAQTLLADLPAPDFLLGASLGEFVAAAVAGVAPVDALLFDVVKQARLFDAHADGGAILIVIDAAEAYESDPLYAGLARAGVNFDRCFAVAGPRGDVIRVAETLRARGVAHQLLPVAHAFHSPLVDPVAPLFHAAFARDYGAARIPLVSCAHDPGAPSTRGFSAAHWWEVIRRPIDFRAAFERFDRERAGAIYVDLGPSGALAGFARHLLPPHAHGRVLSIMTPFRRDRENLAILRDRLTRLRQLEAAT